MDTFKRAVQHLSRLPGVGEKTAARFAYWLLQQPPDVALGLSESIQKLREAVRECPICTDLTELEVCRRCADPRRDASLVCVVERPQDVAVIDSAGEFNGRFHVLHGAISPLSGVGPAQLRIDALLARLDGVTEIILACDPDVEGDATALYLARLIKPLGLRVSRIAHGVAVGTELEYADRSSVARAIENRREM